MTLDDEMVIIPELLLLLFVWVLRVDGSDVTELLSAVRSTELVSEWWWWCAWWWWWFVEDVLEEVVGAAVLLPVPLPLPPPPILPPACPWPPLESGEGVLGIALGLVLLVSLKAKSFFTAWGLAAPNLRIHFGWVLIKKQANWACLLKCPKKNYIYIVAKCTSKICMYTYQI